MKAKISEQDFIKKAQQLDATKGVVITYMNYLLGNCGKTTENELGMVSALGEDSACFPIIGPDSSEPSTKSPGKSTSVSEMHLSPIQFAHHTCLQ